MRHVSEACEWDSAEEGMWIERELGNCDDKIMTFGSFQNHLKTDKKLKFPRYNHLS